MRRASGTEEQREVLRFQVSVGTRQVAAFLSRATCQARGGLERGPHALAEFYRQNRKALDDIVIRKICSGARHPVVVMARDLDGAFP